MSSIRSTASIDFRVVFSSSRTTEKSAATSSQGSAPLAGVGTHGMSEPERPRSRADYERGLPGYHDPTAGFGGAAPAQSALTLRLILAAFGLVVCVAGGIVFLAAGLPVWAAVVLFVLGAVALVDLVVIVRRKSRGEPG